MLLCLDTSSATTLVALTIDGAVVSSGFDDTRSHERVVVPLIEQVLRDAGVARTDLTGIVCGVGPGPFTGLRVGLACALVLGRALALEVAGVCSLDIIAADVVAGVAFAVTSDAKRRELYWATYDAAGRRVGGPGVAAPAVIREIVGGRPVAGVGPLRYPDAFDRVIAPTGMSAAGLAALAVRTELHVAPAPLYLREPDAVAAQVRKPVIQGGRK